MTADERDETRQLLTLDVSGQGLMQPLDRKLRKSSTAAFDPEADIENNV